VLRADPSISRTLEQAVTADVALVGVGGRDDRIDFQQGTQVTPDEWTSLMAQGMVGDIGGRFFDRTGSEIEHELNRRVIGLSLEEFRKIPVRLVAAGGPSKTEALTAALRGGLITVLVTDVTTANTLIEGA
jgi:lsr operon transcriptional repressor